MPFYIYVIHNKKRDKLYVGQTENLENRIRRHNNEFPNKQSSFTSKMSGDWKLVYSEECTTRGQAIKREKELKSFRGREFIKNKIKNMPL